MAQAIWHQKDGSESGKCDLPEALFAAEINEAAVHETVTAYLANQRQGSANAKGRAEVRGGGRKPYRQKGTGRARAGTIRSPLFRGGGVVFGPHPRDYRIKPTKKVKRLALRSSLSSRAAGGDIHVIEALSFDAPKTKAFAEVMKKMNAYGGKVLVVLDKPDQNVIKSARNVPGARVTLAEMVNPYQVLWADKIVMTRDAMKKMEEVFAS
jgi:large subunit ribosomal protein L4